MTTDPGMRLLSLLLSLFWLATTPGQGFTRHLPITSHTQSTHSQPTGTSTALPMVFDFFRERSAEGVEQLSKFGQKAKRGQWGAALAESAAYTAATNQAFADGLARSRVRLLQNLESLVTGVSPEELLEELTDILLQADLGLTTAEDIVAEVQSLRADATTLLTQDDLKSIMRGKIIEALQSTGQSSAIQFAASENDNIPTVLFVMGANGMGKTTTIGKLAHRLRTEGNQTVLLAACDTFRAGAVEQLQQWADRAQVDLVGPQEGKATTPAAVLYNALDKAVAEKYDTVLVDTSGRLSNNDQLTAELAKMKRVIQKRLSVENDADGKPLLNNAVPHETLLVLDAAQGRMALDSAKVWHQEIGLTGLILTKLDGSARGGSVVAVSRDLQLPVKLIGVGEGMEDLRDVRGCINWMLFVMNKDVLEYVSYPKILLLLHSLKRNASWTVSWGLVQPVAMSRIKMKVNCWRHAWIPCDKNVTCGPNKRRLKKWYHQQCPWRYRRKKWCRPATTTVALWN